MAKFKNIHSGRTASKKSVSEALMGDTASGADALFSAFFGIGSGMLGTATSARVSGADCILIVQSVATWPSIVNPNLNLRNVNSSSRAFGQSYTMRTWASSGSDKKVYVQPNDDLTANGWGTDRVEVTYGHHNSAGSIFLHEHNEIRGKGNGLTQPVTDGAFIAWKIGTEE